MAGQAFVYLVGAGPGAADLITLRGLRALQKCEVLIYDRLAGKELLEAVPAACEKIYVGKEAGRHSLPQDEINDLIVEKALEHKTVVRLKGGDPFVFGRGGEEALALLKAGIPFEIVPGVTSAVSVPELAGIPVTHRKASRSFHVMTGHTADGEADIRKRLKSLSHAEGTLVFLMGRKSLAIIAEELLQAGRDKRTPVAMIENGSLPKQRILRGTLQDIVQKAEAENISAPCIIVIGETASYHMKWERRGLAGKTAAIVGTESFTHKIGHMVEKAGGEAVRLPVMEVKKLLGGKLLEETKKALADSRYLVFTSANGVEVFFSEVDCAEELFAGHDFAAIGAGTKKALEKKGVSGAYTPGRYTVEALAEGLCGLPEIREKGVTILRAKQGSAVLTDKLAKNHIPYRDIKIYDVVCNRELLQKLLTEREKWDYIIFGSSSGVRGFAEGAGDDWFAKKGALLPVCIGEVTAETLRSFGCKNILLPKECSAEGILETMLRR